MRRAHKTAQVPIHNSSRTRRKEYLVELSSTGNKSVVSKSEKREFIEQVADRFDFTAQSKKQSTRLINAYKERWQRKILKRKLRLHRSITTGRPIRNGRQRRLNYNEYIKSTIWAARRNRYYQQFGRHCAICGSAMFVELHHMVYTAFDGTEPNENLVPLCKAHHGEYHAVNGSARDMRTPTSAFIAERQEARELLALARTL